MGVLLVFFALKNPCVVRIFLQFLPQFFLCKLSLLLCMSKRLFSTINHLKFFDLLWFSSKSQIFQQWYITIFSIVSPIQMTHCLSFICFRWRSWLLESPNSRHNVWRSADKAKLSEFGAFLCPPTFSFFWK